MDIDIDNIEPGEIYILIKDYKVFGNYAAHGSQTYTIIPKGTLMIFLGKAGLVDDVSRALFSTKENYDHSRKNGSDHYVDINMSSDELIEYVESKIERRKRIIKELCE